MSHALKSRIDRLERADGSRPGQIYLDPVRCIETLRNLGTPGIPPAGSAESQALVAAQGSGWHDPMSAEEAREVLDRCGWKPIDREALIRNSMISVEDVEDEE